MHQVTDFLLFTVGLVATIVRALYGTLVEFIPGSVWLAGAALVLILFLYSRLSSRVEDVEMALLQLDAKLDTLLSRLAVPRDHRDRHDANDPSQR